MKALKIALPALFLALAGPALAQDIVVTGKPLKETEADLEACIERKCPPDQDVAATLAHAENQMVSGDYKGSRRTLLDSLRRNRRHGQAYPVEVSDLLRANSRIAEHLGEAGSYRNSVIDMRDTLKKGLGEDDFRTLVAQVDVGDSRAKLGYPDEAERIYKLVEERALALGNTRVATFARLRQALLLSVKHDTDPNSALYRRLIEKLDAIIKHPLPGAEEFSLTAEVLKARVERKAGSNAATEAIIRRFAERGGVNRPILIYSEPLEKIDVLTGARDTPVATNVLARQARTSVVGQWADIGFWVGPEGHVSDLDMLRSSGSTGWVKEVLKNISKRIYAPLKRSADASPGFYMVERYTLTANFEDETTATTIRTRGPSLRVMRIDLTPELAAATPSANN
jgi:hypothetical protein